MNIDLEKLLETGAHFGHQTKRWNPRMGEYIYGVKDGVSVFDLIKTKEALEQALDVLAKASKDGKLILLVGTKRQIKDVLKKTAMELSLPFVDERWLGGTLTNFFQVKDSVKKLDNMIAAREAGEYKEYTKKERLLIDRDIDKLEKKVGGLRLMNKVPEVMFIVDTHKEHGAVLEAQKAGIEIIGIVDSNADPYEVNWPIPMNDDASAALEYILELIKDAISSSKESVKVKAKSKPRKAKKTK